MDYKVGKQRLTTIISLQVKNIFDHEYRVIKNMPVPGREYRMSFKIQL
jgi:outer membrane cobalamin receptor